MTRTKRRILAVLLAALAVALGAAGVAGSTGEPTNEERAKLRPAPVQVSSAADAPTNEELLDDAGLLVPRAGPPSPGGPANDG